MQTCKEEPISDDEFILSTSVDKDIDKAWYPSECHFKNWKQGKEKTTEVKEEFEKGHCTPQLISFYLYIAEFISNR